MRSRGAAHETHLTSGAFTTVVVAVSVKTEIADADVSGLVACVRRTLGIRSAVTAGVWHRRAADSAVGAIGRDIMAIAGDAGACETEGVLTVLRVVLALRVVSASDARVAGSAADAIVRALRGIVAGSTHALSFDANRAASIGCIAFALVIGRACGADLGCIRADAALRLAIVRGCAGPVHTLG